jgi:SMC interacting uncharacterized protein involved in chromosome segregation
MEERETEDTAREDVERSLNRLKTQSDDLRKKIADEKRRHDMPLDSALGDPEEEARNADGRLDLPDNDDD